MDQISQLKKNMYLAVRGDFVLKVDGSRPILYPLDYKDTIIFGLTPIEGFILSLLSGHRRLSEVEDLYMTFFPDSNPENVAATLDFLDELVKKRPTAAGIGREGIIEYSNFPIESIHHFDPRQFIISPDEYEKRLDSYQTKHRLETPISALCVYTYCCSTNCVYCYADRRNHVNVKEMSLHRWQEIISEMSDLGIRLCSPDNGDVFARKDGIDFLEALLEKNFHFLLSTKCYVSKENVNRLVNAGFNQKINGLLSRTVQLSIDAVDEEVQQRIYRVSPILTRTAETFDNFMGCGIAPRIKAVITGLNFDQPQKIVEYFYPRGARNFHFVKYNRSFFNHFDELFLNKEQGESFKKQYETIRENYPDIDCWEDIIPPVGAEQPISIDWKKIWDNRKGCGGGWLSLGIAPDGKIFLCEQMEMSDKFYVGDLNKQSIMEVWHSKEMLDFIFPTRHQFKDTICYSCKEFEQCMWERGRCYRDAYFVYGTIYDSPPLCPCNTRPGLRVS
jgi:radical SAM protein with 4Fe4S-binding SPASM domain